MAKSFHDDPLVYQNRALCYLKKDGGKYNPYAAMLDMKEALKFNKMKVMREKLNSSIYIAKLGVKWENRSKLRCGSAKLKNVQSYKLQSYLN